VLIDHCWLGEVWWDEPPPANQSSIGILIDGNDHVITDTIIFAFTSIGIEVNSPGTMLHNIHIWNGLHKVAGLGPGIHVGPGGTLTRISDCYLDNTWLNIVDPSRVTVLDGLFYMANTMLVSGPRASIAGLTMQANVYSGPLDKPNVEITGHFARADVSEFKLDDEILLGGGPFVATSVTQVISSVGAATDSFPFEFRGNQSQQQLLFTWIDTVQYSISYVANSTGSRFTSHFAEIDNSSVVVRFETPVTGST
jgi:hypothetical protein